MRNGRMAEWQSDLSHPWHDPSKTGGIPMKSRDNRDSHSNRGYSLPNREDRTSPLCCAAEGALFMRFDQSFTILKPSFMMSLSVSRDVSRSYFFSDSGSSS